ncbi:unnamed protein product [Mortierella alpina]
MCSLPGVSSRHPSSRSSMIVHEDRQEPYDSKPIRDIVQVQQRLNNTAPTPPLSNAAWANHRTGLDHTAMGDLGDEDYPRPSEGEEQHHHRLNNEDHSRISLDRSPVNYGLRRQYFHPLPPPDHNTDSGAGVSPNQSSVFAVNASDNFDIKGKGKKRYKAPLQGMESSPVDSRVQSRILGNGNPYVIFHSSAHPTPHCTSTAVTPGTGTGSGSAQCESQPMTSDGVRHHHEDDRVAKIEVIMPSEPGRSQQQASSSADNVEQTSSGTTSSSASARLSKAPLIQHDESELSMRSDRSKLIPDAAHSQLSSANKDLRQRVRKTLSLEWSPEHKTLTTSIPPLQFHTKQSAAPTNDPGHRLANETRPTSASEQFSQRVRGPRPLPNFEDLQNRKRRSKAFDISPESRSSELQPKTAEQDDSKLVLIRMTNTVPKGQAQQATEQQSSSTTERPSSVLVELSSHDAGDVEQLMQDVQQLVAETTPQKTRVSYPSAPIPIPVPKSHLSKQRPVDNNSSARATYGAGTLPEVPPSPVASTGTSHKRLSNSTSRGTARRIIYSADLEQGLPEGRIARESNFEIVPSNRLSVSSRANSSATASRCCTRPSRFAEGVDFQDVSTATLMVQSNKRGIGRIRSSEAAQRPSKDKIATAISSERKRGSLIPEPVNLDGTSDSDEELDAARYKAEVLQRAAEEAADAAHLAAAKASAAAADVAEAKAARLRLKNERALKVPIQACETRCNDLASSKDSAGN